MSPFSTPNAISKSGACGLLLLLPVALAAQERPGLPGFTAKTELVLVDLVVTDKADRPVRGLTAKDFVVREDGRERPIVSFEAFTGDEAPAVEGESRPPASRARSSATTVLIVDEGQLTPEQAARVRPSLKTLLATLGEQSGILNLLAPWSKISIAASFPGGTVDFVSAVDRIVGRRFADNSSLPISDTEAFAVVDGDPRMLTRVASRFVALNPSLPMEAATALAQSRGNEVAYDARMRREFLYGILLVSLEWLADKPGRHNVVVVSGGFARDPQDSRQNDVVTRSLRVNAPIHFIDARSLDAAAQGIQHGPALARAGETSFARFDAGEGSSGLADNTGGITIRDTNNLSEGVGRVLDTMKTYYILAYAPPAHTKPGFRRIKVDVRPRGLHVRARRGYFDARP
jgi:VWFA-related protein